MDHLENAEHRVAVPSRSLQATAATPSASKHTVLWIDRNPHDMELAILVLARLAPQYTVVGLHREADLEEAIALDSDFSLAVLDAPCRSKSPYETPRPTILSRLSTENPSLFEPAARAEGPPSKQSQKPSADILKVLRERLPNVPLLLFSEISSEEGLNCLRAGFDDFLPKSSRSFLELPQFLNRALQDGADRRLQRDRETRVSRLLDYTGIGVFRANTDGQILDANEAFLQIFGLHDLDHARRSDFTRLIRPDSDSDDERPLRQTKLVGIDRQVRQLRFTQVVLLTPGGDFTIDGLVEDFGPTDNSATQPKGPESATLSTAIEPQIGEASNTSLVRPASEDLPASTPLARDNDSGADEPMSRRPARSTSNLGETLEYQPVLVRPKVSLESVLASVIEDLSVPLDRIQAQVDLGPLPSVPGEAAQLVVLFHNLLENAIRFRSERPLSIVVNARTTDTAVIVSVHDNGIGMSSPALHRILSPNHRGMPPVNKDGQSPLGLAISKRIVEHHRGELWAESILGTGSVFHVSFP